MFKTIVNVLSNKNVQRGLLNAVVGVILIVFVEFPELSTHVSGAMDGIGIIHILKGLQDMVQSRKEVAEL